VIPALQLSRYRAIIEIKNNKDDSSTFLSHFFSYQLTFLFFAPLELTVEKFSCFFFSWLISAPCRASCIRVVLMALFATSMLWGISPASIGSVGPIFVLLAAAAMLG
jgi:hypothetical protein